MPARRLCVALCGLALFSVTANSALAQTKDLVVMMPEKTERFLYLNLQQIVQTPLFQKYLRKPLQDVLARDLKDFTAKTGIDPLRDLEHFFLGSAAKETDGGLIIVQGRFNADKLMAAAREFAQTYQNKTKFTYEGNSAFVSAKLIEQDKRNLLVLDVSTDKFQYEFCVALADQHRLLIGFKNDVIGALDRLASKAKPNIQKKEVIHLFDTMDWKAALVMREGNSELRKLGAVPDPALAKLVEGIDFLRLDVWFDKELKVAAHLEMKDEDAAKESKPEVAKLGDQLKGLIFLATINEPKLKPLGELSTNLTITREKRSIILRTSLSEKAIQELEMLK